MSMPGAIEMSRHYGSMRAFQRAQPEMAEDGWTLESFNVSERPSGLLARIGLGHQTVDAHYLRGDWPTE